MEEKQQPAPQYRIGAVSRLTGIPPVTIRMWERRYAVTEPDRTPAGDRLYSDHDVRRLSLLKLAVDNGNSISNAAKLSESQLNTLINQTPNASTLADEPIRVAIAGNFLLGTLSDPTKLADNVKIVSTLNDESRPAKNAPATDILIIEMPLLDDSSFTIASQKRQQNGARYALVVYQFGTQKAADELNTLTVQAIRAPVSAAQLARSCIALANTQPPSHTFPSSLDQALRQPLPAKRFTDNELAKFSKMTSLVECECPAHMTDIIRSLQAFENYSEQCENSNSNDAAMHQMLHLVTAQARMLMEDAMQALIEHEQEFIAKQLKQKTPIATLKNSRPIEHPGNQNS